MISCWEKPKLEARTTGPLGVRTQGAAWPRWEFICCILLNTATRICVGKWLLYDTVLTLEACLSQYLKYELCPKSLESLWNHPFPRKFHLSSPGVISAH